MGWAHSVVKLSLINLIRIYQIVFSSVMGPHCRFYPTCSSYAVEAIDRFGILKGGYLALRRISHCHPWHPGGVDPVPGQSCNNCQGKISN